jgi:hypothetical protein
MISANTGRMMLAVAGRRRSGEKFLLAECRIRSESFVEVSNAAGGGRRDKGVMG